MFFQLSILRFKLDMETESKMTLSQIAAYGKGFVKASQDTWEMFQKREMVEIVDSDITSAICFLTGICSGSICTIMVAAWTATVHRGYIGTLSVLAALIGYLMVGGLTFTTI